MYMGSKIDQVSYWEALYHLSSNFNDDEDKHLQLKCTKT